jgi:hypothetical protein
MGYIQEANNILLLRYENKSNDILSKQNNKLKIMEDTREISRNNRIINEIKNKIEKIKSKYNSYKTSLIKTQNDMNTDIKKFMEYRDINNSKNKKENDLLLKLRNRHEEFVEKFEKESQKCKKLSEELEKKIKIIYLLKNYGSFIYKILGKKFWLDDIPEINHKTKNFELISDLVIEKYNLLNSKDQLNYNSRIKSLSNRSNKKKKINNNKEISKLNKHKKILICDDEEKRLNKTSDCDFKTSSYTYLSFDKVKLTINKIKNSEEKYHKLFTDYYLREEKNKNRNIMKQALINKSKYN